LESGATGPFVILPGDLDGDGFVDLATVNWFSGSVSIFLNNGNGTFNDTGDVVVTQNGFGVPGRGAIGDLDGDGDLDIAVPFSGGFLVVIFNDGLADFPDQQVIAAGSGPSAVELAHLDGDSQLDIAVVRTGTGRAAILLTRDVGTLSLGSNAGAAGATVEIPVAVTQNRPLSGLSFGLLHDPGLLTPLTVLPGRVLDSAQGGIDPGLFLVDLSPAGGGGVTVECVVDPGPIPIVELAAGVEQEAVVCGYAISAAAGPVATPLAFTSTLGAPPVPVSMTLEGGPVLPVTTGGTVEIFVEADFIRGDSNGSGGLNLADVVLNLNRMFGNLPPSACWGADDVNGSGSVNLSDAVYLLSYLFSGGPEPQAPFPGCAATPDPGSTPACVLFSGCP
ncbi:MAG: FG-GAP-like repeat-containing protein, partial [Planctomycetota bacterium]